MGMKVTAMSQSGITAAIATATGLKAADCKKVLASLAAVATKEVKSTGKFTVPGLAMLKVKTKPATKAGKRDVRQSRRGEGKASQEGRQGLCCGSAEEERLSQHLRRVCMWTFHVARCVLRRSSVGKFVHVISPVRVTK